MKFERIITVSALACSVLLGGYVVFNTLKKPAVLKVICKTPRQSYLYIDGKKAGSCGNYDIIYLLISKGKHRLKLNRSEKNIKIEKLKNIVIIKG